MKIGFLGNTNNYPFMLARAMRRMGHTVEFVVSRTDALHRPEFRYADVQHPYPEWIHDIVFPGETAYVLPNPSRRKTLQILRGCDFVVLNDLGISLARDIGRPYLAMLTGSDLAYYCNPKSESRLMASIASRNPVKRLYGWWCWRRLLNRQRHGVRHAPLIYHFARGLIPASDALLDEIGVKETQRVFFLMAEIAELRFTPIPLNDPIRIFCATRFTWKQPPLPGDSPLDFKGSDVMVRGLGLFWRKHGRPLDIHFVRKGRHVSETVELVEAEGLAGQVTWHDEMTQAEVWRECARADFVFEQFGDGLVTMAGLEAMAAGRPVIANGRPDIIEAMTGEKSPICQAKTPEEVCSQIEVLVANRSTREEFGRLSRAWVERHFTPDHAARLVLDRIKPHLTTASNQDL